MKRIVLLVLIGFVSAFALIACGPIDDSKPTQRPSAEYTDENGMPIETPIPTGCKGKIISRTYDENSETFAIVYNDNKCQPSGLGIITFEEDLNMTCNPGDYWPICREPHLTEPPGIRLPTGDPANPGSGS